MVAYLAMRIIDGALDYKSVIKKFPQYKDEIDTILILEGKQDLIQE